MHEVAFLKLLLARGRRASEAGRRARGAAFAGTSAVPASINGLRC